MLRFLFIFSFFLLATTPVLAQTSEVALIWEAKTYAPVWYEGRTLPTPSSLVRVVAVPTIYNSSGVKLKVQDLDFNWRKDGVEIRSASGAGRDTFDYRAASRAGEVNLIEVNVARRDGVSVAAGEARVSVARPELRFYAIKDGVIDHTKSLARLQIVSDETKIIAEPLFFSIEDWLNRRLSFEWSIKGQKIVPATEDPRRLTVVATADQVGETALDLAVLNKNYPLQSATGKLPIGFGLNTFQF
ncbi:MAG: hypothetical protein AAB455_00125 [Patescibacteria group bacterium]